MWDALVEFWDGSSPDSGPPAVRGRWRRQLRLREIVDDGALSWGRDGLTISGRRTNPLRTIAWTTIRVALLALNLGIGVGLVLTAAGISNSGSDTFGRALSFLLIGFPIQLALASFAMNAIRDYLEPRILAAVHWSDVHDTSSDGFEFEVTFLSERRRIAGRFVTANHAAIAPFLAHLQRGAAPSRPGESARCATIRPAWRDHLVLVVIAVAAILGAVRVQHVVASTLLARSLNETGIALVPERLDDETLRALQSRCVEPVPDAALRTARVGVFWDVDRDRLRPADGGGARRSRELRLDLIAASTRAAEDLAGVVRLPQPQALDIALCRNLVRDVEGLPAVANTRRLRARRVGTDLQVAATNTSRSSDRLVAVRRRRTGSNHGLFDVCEWPAHSLEHLGSPIARETTIPGFFNLEDDDPAVVLRIAASRERELLRLVPPAGGPRPCVWNRLLLGAGIASESGVTDATTSDATINEWHRRGVRAARDEALPLDFDCDGPRAARQVATAFARSIEQVQGDAASRPLPNVSADGQIAALVEGLIEGIGRSVVPECMLGSAGPTIAAAILPPRGQTTFDCGDASVDPVCRIRSDLVFRSVELGLLVVSHAIPPPRSHAPS